MSSYAATRRTALSAVPSGIPEGCWEQLDQVDLAEWFWKRFPMLKTCPHFFRGRLRQCFTVALRKRYRAMQVGDIQTEERVWKVFGLVTMMLMHRPKGTGSAGRDELAKRVGDFARADGQNSSRMQVRPRFSHAAQQSSGARRRTKFAGQAALKSRALRQVVTCTTGGHGGSIGSQNAGHSRTVAGETTPRKGDGYPTRSHGIHAGQTFRVGSCTLHQVPPKCAFWLRAGPRRSQQ